LFSFTLLSSHPQQTGLPDTHMTKALSRKHRGLDDDAGGSARAEARRSGKRLGAWLDDVIRAEAEAFDEEAFDTDDDDDRVETIARRLARGGGARDDRERADEPRPRRWRDDARELRAEPRRRRDEAFHEKDHDEPRRESRGRRAPRRDQQEIFADAAVVLGRRIAHSERQTARALDNLAGLVEDGELSRESAEEGLAFLAKRLGRIESRLSEQPSAGANARPIRSALARLEARLDELSDADRVSDVERALEGLDQRLEEIARRLDPEPRARDRAPSPAADHAEPPPRRPLDAAIAEITRRQRALNAAEPTQGPKRPEPAPAVPSPAAPVVPPPAPAPDVWDGAPPAERFAAVHASLDSISSQLETVRQGAAQRADQQLVGMRQIEGLRRDLEEMSGAIGDLAPRASVAAIETALHDLARRVETQRCRGVADDLLAPAERIAGELRAAIRDLDPSPIVRNLHADVLTIGRRLDSLQQPSPGDATLVRDLVARVGEIREQLAALAARPLPLEKIETRLVDLAQRVDALTRTGVGVAAKAAAALDMGEVARSIRAIVSTETNASFDTFNGRLEQLAGKVDALVASAGGKRIDELGKRIDDLGQMISKRFENGAAQRVDTSGLEKLVAGLARKLDTALEHKPETPALEEIGRKLDTLGTRLLPDAVSAEAIARIEGMLASPPAEKQFRDLAQRIDGMRETLAQRLEQGGAEGPAIGAIEHLVRGLDRKVETALAAHAHAPDIEPLRRQLEQLSQKIDRLDDPGAHSTLSAAATRNPQLDDIAARLDRMQSALAHRVEEASPAARQFEMAELVEQLAARINQAADSQGDAEAFRALETQIGALSKRLDRNDHNGAALAAVEGKIAALVAQMEETKSATSLAAEEAVRRATQEILREASPGPGALRAALERELADIRDKQDASGQRTHETLLAVHETLERVVDRLAMFEDELTEIRTGVTAPAKAGAAAQPASAAEPRPPSRLTDDDELGDFLMPPGAPRPQRRETAFAAAPESAQMDFIAAARRAAQQAARDAAAAETAYQERRNAALRAEAFAESGERAPESKSGGLLAAIQERKRPLLLGLGALVLMIGAYQIARVGIEGADKWRQDSRHAEAAHTESDAEPEAAPGPGAPARTGASQGAAKTPALAPATPARPSANAPEAAPRPPAAPPPRMLAPQAETPGPLDKTPVGSIGGAGLNPLPPPDAVVAIRALAEGGDPGAQYELALRMAEGRGVPRDPATAAQWFEKAAGKGVAPAQYRLGSLYEKGLGVARDYSRARKLYQSAAEAGNARAMHNLAVLLAEGGDGGKPDYAVAAEWFRRAGEYGVRDSQYNLAILYARGLGVGQSLVQSYVWFSAAAEQGDADAAKKRDEVATRLDSKELTAAKAAAAAFHAKEPPRTANEAPAPAGGWEKAKAPGAPGPATRPPTKPKISAI
jgi:localization factor PodJL